MSNESDQDSGPDQVVEVQGDAVINNAEDGGGVDNAGEGSGSSSGADEE